MPSPPAVAADPHVALVVDGDAVVRRRATDSRRRPGRPSGAAGCRAGRTRESAAPSEQHAPVFASSAASIALTVSGRWTIQT